jgi:endonuclease/exonuclease/phosphatase family metal-dependent hydrolase
MLRTTMAAAAVGAVAVTTLAAPAAQAAVHTPSRLHAVSSGATSIRLVWGAVPTARAYQVQASTSRSMASARTTRFTRSAGSVGGLRPGRRYFFRVAVIDPRTHARISGYTRGTLPSRATTSIRTPGRVRVVAVSPSSVTLAWTASDGAAGYRVARSTTPGFDASTYTRTTRSSVTVAGLSADTPSYFRVQAVTSTGTALTTFSTAVPGETSTAPTSTPALTTSTGPGDVRVGSFNVMTATGDRTEGNRLPWAQRRATVVGQILGEHVDVVGVQEVTQTNSEADRMVDGANQFLDLRNGLNQAGGTFALTNESSYNCVNPRTSYKCAYEYRGASGGDRIYYDTTKLTMLSAGSYAYPTQNLATPSVTYALAYAYFSVKATGARFMFTSTHLDPPSRTVRVAQWHELIAEVNQLKGSLPVVNVGDYNTQKMDEIAQTMLPAMQDAGYGDVLHQSYGQNLVTDPRALSTVNAWVNSLNRYNRDVRTYSYFNNHARTGNSIDWIFATNSLPVQEFKMVSDFDPATLQVQGTMPSDHHMIRATLTLP